MIAEAKSVEWVEQEHRVPDHPLTYEEFLEWNDGMFAEWVDGEVVYMAAASYAHSDISSFLTSLLRLHADRYRLGRVLVAPYQMRLRNVRRGREPDIFFVANSNLANVTHDYLDGPADLAIEVVSPESVQRDYGDKFREYEREGVREYWIIDPMAQRAQFHILADTQFRPAPVDVAGIYDSVILSGFWLNVNWLWQEPLPLLPDVLNLYSQLQRGTE